MCTLSVSNVIYHKFSHDAAFCTLNGENVNVMLEFCINDYNDKKEAGVSRKIHVACLKVKVKGDT